MDDLREYIPTLVGLAIGAFARFGNLVAQGRVPSTLQVVGYIMQLGAVGVVAVVSAKWLGFTDPDAKLATAVFLSLSAQEVVQLVKRRTLDKLKEIAR